MKINWIAHEANSLLNQKLQRKYLSRQWINFVCAWSKFMFEIVDIFLKQFKFSKHAIESIIQLCHLLFEGTKLIGQAIIWLLRQLRQAINSIITFVHFHKFINASYIIQHASYIHQHASFITTLNSFDNIHIHSSYIHQPTSCIHSSITIHHSLIISIHYQFINIHASKLIIHSSTFITRYLTTSYMFVVVNFDALAQASDIRIERRQVVFLCWRQDSNPSGSQTPNRQQTECPLTNRLSYRGSS